jgi:ribosome biogenesis GTPase / thiamine phosphate phosphatase
VLERIGFDARTARSFGPWRGADAVAGRVVRVDAGVATVITEAGTQRVTFGGALLCQLAEHPDGTPCAGDWAVVRRWPDGRTTLEHVLPRHSVLAAGGGAGTGVGRGSTGDALLRRPPLAANMDIVAVVAGPAAARPPARLRALVELAVGSGATPLLVLPADDGAGGASTTSPPVPTTTAEIELVTSPVADLRARVAGRRTIALLGYDAAVLAELVRELAGAHPIGGRRTGRQPEVPRGAATLCMLPEGGAVLDVLLPTSDSSAGTRGPTAGRSLTNR